MTQMIRWYDEEYELNVVLYPQDSNTLRMLQQKLLKFFPFAKPLADYPFPAMLCRKSTAQLAEEEDIWKSLSGTSLCRFQAKHLILENNHLLIEYLPSTQEDAAALEMLLGKVSPGEPGHLVMPIAWLPLGQQFSCQILDQLEVIWGGSSPEITVDLFRPEFYFVRDWNREWGDAFGIPRPLLLDKLFPSLEYEMIPSSLDDCCSFASFCIPKGYWYCTSSNREAKHAERDLSIYQSDGYVKMVDPNTDPPTAVMYCWISSEDNS